LIPKKCLNCVYSSTTGTEVYFCLLMCNFIKDKMLCKGKNYIKSQVENKPMQRPERVKELIEVFKENK